MARFLVAGLLGAGLGGCAASPTSPASSLANPSVGQAGARDTAGLKAGPPATATSIAREFASAAVSSQAAVADTVAPASTSGSESTPSPTVRPSSTWTPRRPLEVQRVELALGQPSQRLPVVAPADQSVLFIVYGRAGQILTLRLEADEGRGSLRISGADASLWLDERAGRDEWAGALPSSQDYLIEVIALDHRRFAGYLDLALADTTPIAQPIRSP